jgi:hypothetical protein
MKLNVWTVGRAPMPEYQNPGDSEVHNHSRQRDPKHHLGLFQGRKIAFEHHDQQGRHDPPPADAQEVLRQARNLGVLSGKSQYRCRPPHDRHDRHAVKDRKPKPHPGVAPHLHLVLAPNRRGDHSHDRNAKPRTKDEQHKEE